ncbi:MAG: TonB family protein [Gemmatimonadetes bacterium]|nr:TonB family protein [Gemmatimonadota bacterium]
MRLTRAIQMVRPVVVNAVLSRADTRLEEIRERQRTGGNGHYAYRADFMKYNPPAFTDVLRRIPGIALFRTSRGAFDVRLRGNRCPPLYWLDGTPLMGIPFDPDALQPSTVEAIEVYSSASLVPPRFQGPPQAQGCGAIVIWTRHGERPVRAPKIDADSIVRLLDAQRLFVATEVEVPARVKAMQEPDFPDSLKMAGVSGSAVIEFIIEANGTLNKESIGIVSATHVRFADAVRLAILDATFEPARKADRPVAQVFQLPVTFTAPRGPERQ